MDGYHALCSCLEQKKSEKAVLALATPGGDPHAGFRIARALQHEYGEFYALIPRYCKSAGTLIVLGASRLYMSDMSELGPLDIQIKKDDELYGRNSGLDIFEAVSFLKNQTIDTFQDQLNKLISNGLSTKVASDIAAKLTRGIYEPIASQIDPLKLAEFQRANDITIAYGERLSETGKNLISKYPSLISLVAQYPSHGFVIDRKEARKIFKNVEEPLDSLKKLCNDIGLSTFKLISSERPYVTHSTIELEITDEKAPISDDAQAAFSGNSKTGRSKNIPDAGETNGSKKGSRSRANTKEAR